MSPVSPSPHINEPMPMSTLTRGKTEQLIIAQQKQRMRTGTGTGRRQQDKDKKKRTTEPAHPAEKSGGVAPPCRPPSRAVLGPACASARPDSLGRNQNAPLVVAVQRHGRTNRLPPPSFFFPSFSSCMAALNGLQPLEESMHALPPAVRSVALREGRNAR